MYTATTNARQTVQSDVSCLSTVAVIGAIVFGTGSAYVMDDIGAWRDYVQPRVPFQVISREPSPSLGTLDARTHAQHIENARTTFGVSIADLAGMLKVSRQAIYKWLSGTMPEPDSLSRIVGLSQAADAFRTAKASHAGSLLRMKAFEGRSLMDLLKAGEASHEHIDALIAEARAMDASYQSSGLPLSRSTPTDDWRASISIPGSSERDS